MTPDEPRPDRLKSGRVLVRMPISMHEHLSETAHADGVSMNQFICGVLAVAIGWRSQYRPEKPMEQIHHDLAWDMWTDRVRRGEVRMPGRGRTPTQLRSVRGCG